MAPSVHASDDAPDETAIALDAIHKCKCVVGGVLFAVWAALLVNLELQIDCSNVPSASLLALMAGLGFLYAVLEVLARRVYLRKGDRTPELDIAP